MSAKLQLHLLVGFVQVQAVHFMYVNNGHFDSSLMFKLSGAFFCNRGTFCAVLSLIAKNLRRVAANRNIQKIVYKCHVVKHLRTIFPLGLKLHTYHLKMVSYYPAIKNKGLSLLVILIMK